MNSLRVNWRSWTSTRCNGGSTGTRSERPPGLEARTIASALAAVAEDRTPAHARHVPKTSPAAVTVDTSISKPISFEVQACSFTAADQPVPGPYHYSKAEEILAEIEATNALSSETGTALALRARAYATLALAAATAINPDRSGKDGVTSQESDARIPSIGGTGQAFHRAWLT